MNFNKYNCFRTVEAKLSFHFMHIENFLVIFNIIMNINLKLQTSFRNNINQMDDDDINESSNWVIF